LNYENRANVSLATERCSFYRRTTGSGFKIEIDGNQIAGARPMELLLGGLGWLYNLMNCGWDFLKESLQDVVVLCCSIDGR